MPTETFFNLPDTKRQLILDLAIEEFANNDYNEASISRIVARAGIAKGSFYQYFADKRELYDYLLNMAVTEKNAFLQVAPPDPGIDLFAHLRWLFRTGLEFQFSNPLLAQVAYRAVYGKGPMPEETKTLVRENSAAFFRGLVQIGMARNQIEPGLDEDLVAFLLNHTFTGFGDYLLQRMDIPPSSLATGDVRDLDRPDYWQTIDDLLLILQHGLQPVD